MAAWGGVRGDPGVLWALWSNALSFIDSGADLLSSWSPSAVEMQHKALL